MAPVIIIPTGKPQTPKGTPTIPVGDSVSISFTDINFTVTDRNTGQQKTILHGASGLASPGRLLAIMGPSGAGKSTLLDVLAGNMYDGAMEGQMLVNGDPIQRSRFQKVSCYVQQKDVLMSSATVREALMTSALLRLPLSISYEEKKARVEAVMKELDLTTCADTLIGDESIGLKGISGGQKRRVSVGIELVKDPRVIFLDEPTSGLDSEMALNTIDALAKLASRGRTVVCTIHQPNSDITDYFDDFMLLAAGRVMYSGPWPGAVSHFEGCGYRCPMYKNPTDYFMRVVSDAEAASKLSAAYELNKHQLLSDMSLLSRTPRSSKTPNTTTSTIPSTTTTTRSLISPPPSATLPLPLPPVDVPSDPSCIHKGVLGAGAGAEVVEGRNGHVAFDVEQGGGTGGMIVDVRSSEEDGAKSPGSRSSSGSGGGEGDANGPIVDARSAPLYYQVGVLVTRNFRAWIRNPLMLGSELVQYIFIAVFIGLMYQGLSGDAVDGVFDRSACIWFIFAILCFTPSYTAIATWDQQRHLLRRELKQQQYSIFAYYLSRNAVLIPFQLMQCALFTCVVYFFVGFQTDVAKFFTFFAVLSMFQIISEGMGMICALVTRQATYAIILLTFILLLLLSFSGFLVTKVPVYFVWVQKASYFTYAFAGLMQDQFTGITFQSESGPVPGLDLLPSQADTGLSLAGNIGVLVAELGGMELVKLGSMALAHRFNMM